MPQRCRSRPSLQCVAWCCQVETCTAYFSISKQMLWSEVDADVLEETAKHLLKETNSKLNSSLRSCDAFQGLIRTIKNFLSTCPLILQLRQPSMRPRHWKQLQVRSWWVM